jgi:nitrogenase subunit NifH
MINRNNKNNSTIINVENNKVLNVGCNHKKYSTKMVIRKYKNPKPIKKSVPRSSSFV